MRNRILREQIENDMETIISNIIKFNNYISELSDEQKKEFLNNPKIEDGKGNSLYDKALTFLKDYNDSLSTDAGKEYLSANDQKVTNAFREFQNNLVNTFPSVYNSDFEPVVMEIINSGDAPEEVETSAASEEASPEEIKNATRPDGAVDVMDLQDAEADVEADPDGLGLSGAVSGVASTEKEAEKSKEPSTDFGANDAESAAEERLNIMFKKYMGGEYDPSSALDRGKIEVLRSALKEFYDTNNNKRFDINNPEDVKKFQPIVNKAYTSPEYKNAARYGKNPPPTAPSTSFDQVETPPTRTVPKNGPTITYGKMKYPAYADMGGGRYQLASQEQLDDPNIQLYIPNPKKGQTEYNKPNFVRVRRENMKQGMQIRPQSQYDGAVGSASNFFGDLGNTLAKPFRREASSEKNNKKSKTSKYEKNPEGVDSFFK
jgi:hypothetical protein